MATKIIRYSNRAEFQIENLAVDFATEDVEVVDYVNIDINHIYFIGGSRKELVAKEIGSRNWKEGLIDHDLYQFNDCDELIKTGHTKATYYHWSVDVYAGLHAKRSLAKWARIALPSAMPILPNAERNTQRTVPTLNCSVPPQKMFQPRKIPLKILLKTSSGSLTTERKSRRSASNTRGESPFSIFNF